MHDLPLEHLSMVSDALRDFPRPDLLALEALQTWLRQQGIDASPLEIDVVTVHYQREPLGEGRTHFRENALITQKMNLVEALLCNWQGETAAGYGGFHYGNWAGSAPTGALHLVERLGTHELLSNYSDYEVFNGLYQRTQPAAYGPANRVAVRAEDLQSFIWGLHFHQRYIGQLDTYWKARFDLYQRAIKINFIAACNRQVSQGSLTDAGRRIIWQVAGLVPRPPQLRIAMLNVYGYVSTSILCLQDSSTDRTLLYIPGNRYPFHEFDDTASLQHWFATQCQDAATRNALLQHFSPGDWPDGLDFSGVRTALKGLARYPKPYRLSSARPGFTTSGIWRPTVMVNYRPARYSPPIQQDVFRHLARWHQKRSYADADSQIVSNHQIDKANWTNYLKIAMGMLLPVAMVLPALAPLLAIGGLAQFTLGLDKVLNGADAEAKAEGVDLQVFGLLNAAPLASALVQRSEAVFRYWRPGFFSSTRLAQRLGAPMGAAPLLDSMELQRAELAFREIDRHAQPMTPAVIKRIDSGLMHRFSAQLMLPEGVSHDWVEYELQSDAFIRTRDARQPDPERWVAIEGDPQHLTRQQAPAAGVTDAMRMARLRSLGIDVDLPIDLAAYDALPTSPIARRITSIWTGNHPLGSAFIDALAHNAQALRDSAYHYQLLISRLDLTAYQDNLKLLQARAPTLEVLPLEDQPFFHAFADSAYYPQYQAALGNLPGTQSNFSSACDILRYRLLAEVGGLYMDADDLLLLPSRSHEQTLPLERIPLATTADGLLLSPPVSNDQMGMYIQFNSSLIGSHPGNPTLDAISEEILQRYQRSPSFYHSRPDAKLEPVRFADYAHQLSQMTGPGVLNAVIDRQLPWLRQLRELCNLLVSPIHDLHQRLDLAAFLRVMRQHVPLNQVAAIGSAHSWAQP
ncbi:mannosyltransferase [Pseudomonas sp. RP23018S]|uniref:dermonecrotic toxin domain-containing protein n=1 Tax=Pseudomonas sp. RP23018S TaxID=3096037 RepID=UPI002ACA12A1|nr:DUF6543 domain-containing protein [Pseudomonas sp. RP23018S]MDZ5601608.1 mannosyltransferase [Pseudomonas sp. RP23018S]